MRKIVTAFDHAGVDLKEVVHKSIRECGFEVIDVGTDSHESVDFPDYAYLAAQKILSGEAYKGIFVCGSGIGMSLAANKIKGIYAAVCHDVYSAHQAVEHDDINVLCLGSRVIGSELCHDLVLAYLCALFNNKPNQIRRMDKVRQIEAGDFEPKNNAARLYELGQSIWLDNIRRGELKNGKIAADIEHGIIRGMTSNPSIFRKAIDGSKDYDNALLPMALANVDAEDIFTQLVVEDIRSAANLFRDLYIRSEGKEGYVSLEVSPLFAHDTEKTIAEAKTLWKAVNRPNVMIKIPVTEESLPAITELTAAGLNLNLTLVFSPEQYTKAAKAYIAGLKRRLEQGDPIENIRSAASVFVSRIDTKADTLLAEKSISVRDLMGKAAIRNAQLIYNLSREIFSSEEFEEIRARGGNAQRVLWASTSTKNPHYRPAMYVESLIGEDTVNTIPPETLEKFMRSGIVSKTLPADPAEISAYFAELAKAGIDMDGIYRQLEAEGIAAFEKDYLATVDSIRTRCESIRKDMNSLQEQVEGTLQKLDLDSVMRRIFSKDPTVWTFNTQAFAEIRARLGWLDTYKTTETALPEYTALRNELKKEGIDKILLLGMGGSSLAPEVMAKVFDDETDIKLQILDSTDPFQVLEARKEHDPKTTLFIVSSKSGGTAEVRAFLDYFYDQAKEALGENAGSRFIAITDPGTGLEKTARDLGFRKIFLSDASVGGRFSALTPFGMVPAILMGLDPQLISLKVSEIMKNCSASLPVNKNEGASLGAFIGTAALQGRDKLTILTDPSFRSFGSWLEQLIAESSGKEGKGIIPIVNEPELEDKAYADDRVFVWIDQDGSRAETAAKIREQGHPVFVISVENSYDLFREFYRWEIAAAVACSILSVNAFDQPDVQDSKTRTAAKINAYLEKGKLEDLEEVRFDDGTEVWAPDTEMLSGCRNYNDVITHFISGAAAGKDYIAINAYLPRNEDMEARLQNLRGVILRNTGCATTLGFGPRFLHSTGQLHKGGTDNGLFIQIVADPQKDQDIPNEGMSFSVLERAQALGDLESLAAKNRRVIRIRIRIRYRNGSSLQV
ncbi:MAG: bifunctional transaldolase/phosoglucose isomerase [Flexilinea sp.]|nr:bifunctional transaldolase/phosoglucose isomerase [Flexilinea sp.]